MYAIIETGGKQYRVEEGDVIDVELVTVPDDKKITFSSVLFFDDGKKFQVGSPHLKNCQVIGEYMAESKGPKVIAYKYKRRKNYHKKIGHRQKYARVKILEIKAA